MGLLVLAVVGIASRADAGIITVPPGLAPGSQYRLVFVTDNDYTATSSSITDYNNDVNSEANSVAALAALGTTWLDIGSTATVNAISNIGIDAGVPIYDLEGNLIASDAGTEAGGMFSGTLYSPPDFTEYGATSTLGWVWTGATVQGGVSGHGLGTGSVELGRNSFTDYTWIAYTIGGGTTPVSLYGISAVLTVPGRTTPEPATTGMVIAAGALMFFAGRRNRRPL